MFSVEAAMVAANSFSYSYQASAVSLMILWSLGIMFHGSGCAVLECAQPREAASAVARSASGCAAVSKSTGGGWGCASCVVWCCGLGLLSGGVMWRWELLESTGSVVASLVGWSICGAAWWPVFLFSGCCGGISCVVRVGCLPASPDGGLGGSFLGGGLSVGVAVVW